MTFDTKARSTWSTTSSGGPAYTQPMDLNGPHPHLCQGGSGRIHALRGNADPLDSAVELRLLTGLVGAVALVCLGLVFW